MLKTTYHGIMLAVNDAERRDLLDTIEQVGSQWVNDIESDDLYIIVGDNLSTAASAIIQQSNSASA